VLAISIIETESDRGAFANKYLLFSVDPTEYAGKKVLAVPRCCQVKNGTQDRRRINGEVADRYLEVVEHPAPSTAVLLRTAVTATYDNGLIRSKISKCEGAHNYSSQVMHNYGKCNDSENEAKAEVDAIGRSGHRVA
jgi:hypothetical protein